MRVYISGKMTGCPNLNRHAFEAATKRLREHGHFVINPHDLTPIFGTAEVIEYSFQELYILEDGGYATKEANDDAEEDAKLARSIMDADLAAVRSCDAIYLLRGWESSRGAKKELAEAIACRLQVMLEDKAVPVEQTEAQETTTEATCPRGETTNMGCVFCYDGVVCSETNEVCPYYNKEEES